MTPKELMAEAEKARRSSYSPYSKFAVGAALLTSSGRVFLGCNVENSSFGLACCAERTAVFKAVSEGEREFVAVAVTAGKGHGAAPCGACRQVLHEFSPGMAVYFRDGKGTVVKRKLTALLADGFTLRPRRGAK
jgi:cytidine deaminase